MRILGLLLVGMLALGVFAPVKTGAQQQIVLRVLDEGPIDNVWHKAAMEYERFTNGRVKVEWVSSPWPGIYDRLAASFASGDTPIDVTKTWGGWTVEFWPFFHPVDNQWPRAKRESVLSFALHPVAYAGHIYGVPRHVTLNYFHWNKKLFREAGLDPESPPKTYDELVAACTKLTRDRDNDGRIDQWGYVESMEAGSPLLNAFERWLYRAGGEVLDAQGNPVFNDRRGVRAAQALHDLIYRHKCMDPGALQLGNPATRQVFNAARAAMMSMWGSGWAEANNPQRASRDVLGQVGLTILPALDPSVTRSATIHGSEGYAITKAAAQRGLAEEAWRLLQYMTRYPVQIEGLRVRGYMPPLQEAYEEASLKRDPFLGPLMAATSDAGKYPVKRFVWVGYSRIEQAVEAELQNAFLNRKPIPDALNAAAAAVTRILKP